MEDFDLIKKCLWAVRNREPIYVVDTTSDSDDSAEFWVIPESVTISDDNVILRDREGSWDTKSGWQFQSLAEVCN